MTKYTFPKCGCEFEIDNTIKLEDGRSSIIFNPDISEINLDCKKTWDLIGSGLCTGLFQLESKLGSSFAKKLKPENIHHLAALIAILRPGALEAIRDKKSVTMHYIDRKNKVEEITYFHPALEHILKDTYGEMIYQEQILSIAKEIAGFTLVEADSLRKIVGKKLAKEMSEIKDKFIDGCIRVNIVNKEEAEQLFEWIKKSQRYLFNACVTYDTTVETKDGIKTIEDVRLDEEILTLDNKWTKVVNKYHNGLQEVYEIVLENNNTIKCTANHKFLCGDDIQRPLTDIIKVIHNGKIKNINDRTLYHTILSTKHKTYYECATQYDIKCKYDFPQSIKTIANLGLLPTLNIEVDHPQHIYYANGMATSNSHSYSYAMNSYLSAYTKSHFPRAFFTSYLRHANSKPKPYDEVYQLVQNARLMSISIQGPDFRYLHPHFKLTDKIIRFGFLDVKGIGESVWKKMLTNIKAVDKDAKDWSWLDFLIYYSDKITSTAINAIINTGALSYMDMTRTRMIYEYETYNKLSDKEKAWIKSFLNGKNTHDYTLKDIFKEITLLPCGRAFACQSEPRKIIIQNLHALLENPPYNMEDSPAWISATESSLLGIPITCTGIDSCDTSSANCTCIEYIQGNAPKTIFIAATINKVNEIKTKTGQNKGQKMAFLEIGDITGNIDSVVVFPNTWEEVKKIAFQNNEVLLHGEKSKDGSFICKNMWQI